MSMYCELVLRARHIRDGFDKFCPKVLLVHITLSKIRMNEKNPDSNSASQFDSKKKESAILLTKIGLEHMRGYFEF